MILRRLGNKSKIAKKIQFYFPPHKLYVEAFFGAGGMFFNKPRAKYNIVNDYDSDVWNLYNVILNEKEEFIQEFIRMPIHESLLDYWRKNKENEPIKKALRFILLSNFTYLGKGDLLLFGTENPKKQLLKNLDFTWNALQNVQFSNRDFRDFFKQLRLRNSNETFIYCDPPYINTNDNYSSSFSKKDTEELIHVLKKTCCRFAISEFNSNEIIELANKNDLNIIYLCERQNLKNRRTEILLTNYKNTKTLF